MRYSPLDLDRLDEFAALGSIRDPFNRLIIAAARKLGGSLITKDAGIAGSGLVPVVWK
jgi:PIN domain nuclease of toxin-antitoxin system